MTQNWILPSGTSPPSRGAKRQSTRKAVLIRALGEEQCTIGIQIGWWGSLMAKEAFALAWRQVRVSEEGGKDILGGGNCLGIGRKAWKQEVQFGCSRWERLRL